ncbi:hypothetical protein IAR50_002551 [Cryptococcus sp. DSM 104548]
MPPSPPPKLPAPSVSISAPCKGSVRPSATDPSSSCCFSERSQDPPRKTVKAAQDLPLECDSILLERDLAKFFPSACKPPTPPEWPKTVTHESDYYQPLAKFLNSVLDVAREAYRTSGKSVEYCALDTLFTEQFRWMAYDKYLISRSEQNNLKPDLVGCKLKNLSLFDDSTQSLVLHPDHWRASPWYRSYRVDEAHMITFGEIKRNNTIYEAVVQAFNYARITLGSQPNRRGVRFLVISAHENKLQAGIAELDMGGIHLTHIHNLKDPKEYERFWRLLAGMYCSPIDDHGCNRRIRFYADEDGEMVLKSWSYRDGVWRCVEECLCDRNNLFSRCTCVNALHPAGSTKITKYEEARQALARGIKKRKEIDDPVTQPGKRTRTGEDSVSVEGLAEKMETRSRQTAAVDDGHLGVPASSPIFTSQNIDRIETTDMNVLVQSSAAGEHFVETTIYNPVSRHNDTERSLYQTVEDALSPNQCLLGVARFASRRQGAPTRAGSSLVGDGSQKGYYIGLQDSDGFEVWDDLAQDVAVSLNLSTSTTPANLSAGKASSVQPKRIIRRVETLQETVTRGINLIDVYEKHGRVVFVKAILGALYGYRNILRSGWLHRDISVNNIIFGSTKDLELCDLDLHHGRATPIHYDLDCLSGDKDERLCGMLIGFDLAIKRERDAENHEDGKALLTGTLSFMATVLLDAYEENQETKDIIPAAHSPIFDLESFFWVLIYVPLYVASQGGTNGTSEAKTFQDLFGSFPNSMSNRPLLLYGGLTAKILRKGRCLTWFKELLIPIMESITHYRDQSIEAMGNKEGKTMCPWTKPEEDEAVEKFIGIFRKFLEKHAEDED